MKRAGLTIPATSRWCGRVRRPRSRPKPTCCGSAKGKPQPTNFTSLKLGGSNEACRPDRETSRHQAREELDLEIHLRADWRHVAGDDHRRAARQSQAYEAPGGGSGQVV